MATCGVICDKSVGGSMLDSAMAASLSSLFPSYPMEDHLTHRAEISGAIQRVLESGRYILGEEVLGFEREFAAFLGRKHAVGVASGTDAIEVMLRGLGIGAGDKVVVPAHAPSAVAAGVIRSGAALVFADIEAGTFTLCPESLDAIMGSKDGVGVKAVLVVHIYGHPADWASLERVAEKHGILLLEDCAQSHGASWQGRKTGSLGKAAAFSFYPTKNLAAVGDAGTVVTDDPALAERMRAIRQYGWQERFNSSMPGVNSRLDELQAAVLRTKLPSLEESVGIRRRLAARYDQRLGTSGKVITPQVRSDCAHAYHQYVVRSARRDELLQHLNQSGIGAAVHYPVPLHHQPAYCQEVTLKVTEQAVATILSLPLHPYLSDEAVDAVCDTIESLDHAGS